MSEEATNFNVEKFEKDLEELTEEAENDQLELGLDLDNIENIDSELEEKTKTENDISIAEEELKDSEKPQDGFEQTIITRRDEKKKDWKRS